MKKALPIGKVLLEVGGPTLDKVMKGDMTGLDQSFNQGIQNVQTGAGGTLTLAATMYILGFLVPGRIRVGKFSIGIN